ncbi:MAG: septal ring lytic transglycosylase RlpA family protein [Gluconacetobacter diazotrophicus]|nr:septal ring lytic transglycosylase RlpA family protein [Gluconacetobacter diazotrophicus]
MLAADATSAAVQPAAGDAARPATSPATSWARSVEQRLEARAHRVADAGRSALAWSESGIASWYGGRWTGHRTSSGRRFDPMQLTCAHPTLPLGTKLLVTSENTGRSVVVTVNDRGPFGGRIIDLSRAAAQRIGMLGSGTASVTVQQATPEIVEVAQAADDDTSDQAIAAADSGGDAAVSPSPRGRPHTHRASR